MQPIRYMKMKALWLIDDSRDEELNDIFNIIAINESSIWS